MDRYKKLMCVKGLLMSLDEQIYRVDQEKGKTVIDSEKMQEVYDTVLDQYWDAIKEQLGFPNERERLIKELHKQGFISAEDKLKLLNVKITGEGLNAEYNFTINGKTYTRYEEKISYEEVVSLADYRPDHILTVTYSCCPNSAGSMTEGDIANLVNGMNFSVHMTNKA